MNAVRVRGDSGVLVMAYAEGDLEDFARRQGATPHPAERAALDGFGELEVLYSRPLPPRPGLDESPPRLVIGRGIGRRRRRSAGAAGATTVEQALRQAWHPELVAVFVASGEVRVGDMALGAICCGHDTRCERLSMPGTALFEKPRWLRDLLRFLPLKSQFVLSGNIRDLQACEVVPGTVTAQSFNQTLCDALLDAGYAQVLAWDPLAGFRVLGRPGSEAGATRRCFSTSA